MKKIFTILALTALTFSMNAGELTVADGTTTNWNVPITCSYGDEVGTRTQFIYPASMLTDLLGNNLNSMKFYADKAITWSSGDGTIPELAVRMKEVDYVAVSEYAASEALIEVYSGQPASGVNELFFEFDNAFSYTEGKNLLVEVAVVTKGGYQTLLNFYGNTNSDDYGCSRAKYGSNDVKSYFLPKALITYSTDGGGTTCPKPSQLSATTTPDGAVFTWEGEEEQYQWCVVEKGAEAAGWALLSAKTYTATGLEAGKEYDFYVRTYCDETSQSGEAKLSFTPVCKAPVEVKVSELTHAAATLSWEAVTGISKYQFVCVRKDSTPEWESVEAKAVLTVTVDTLKPATSYDFYVRSYFSEAVQSAATKLTFTTNCVAEEIPYVETFAAGSIPNCWNAGSKWSIDTSNEDHTTGGTTGFLRYSTGAASACISPSVELSEEAILDFYYQNRNNASAIPFDIIVLDASNEAELVKESITTVSPDKTWVQKSIDLSSLTGKTIKIKFYANGSKGYIRIDDISITAKPCTTPTGLEAAASTTGAIVTWTAGGSEAAWNLRYKAVGAEEWTEIKNIDEPTDTITGCAPETEYEVQVQAACNGDKQSPWTASALFTPTCPVPTELAVKVVEDDRALIAWECTENVFNLQYKAADAEEWKTVESLEAKTYTLTNLAASTTYQVKVQTACGSAYTDAISFATRCAPLEDTIPYVLHMDSVAVGSMPECWFVLPRTAEVEVALMNDSTHRLLIAGEQECWIVLPALDAELQGLTVSVTWSGSALQEIGYLTTADPETFVPLAAFSGLPAECNLRNASSDAKYVAFHYAGTSEFSIGYIAQVQIAETTDETAIYTPTTNNQTSHKMLRDGQLLIEHNGTLYNAQGQKL